jgi:imidazoleglycerol-phosphate dehydratase / histidinol-phosphatase
MKYLFIDRDGTLICEPADFQIDSIEKFALLPDVIPALISLRDAGYRFVMVTNQDGLGTNTYPQRDFDMIQNLLMGILHSQGLKFEEVLICPHRPEDNCSCRKPKTELVSKYISSNEMDRSNSYVIGDRTTDVDLAKNMGIKSHLLSATLTWKQIAHEILNKPRTSQVHRKTKETDIEIKTMLDPIGEIQIQTGIGFFDHMLEQIARHGKFDLQLKATGDLHIDEHHLVEDVALALGQCLRLSLGDKRGIERYGFWLPMDEASTKVTLDLSGRPSFQMTADFPSSSAGGLSTEMVTHFFRSLAESLGMSLQIQTQGENTHHMVESIFKAVGRSLAIAFSRNSTDSSIPSTKGIL